MTEKTKSLLRVLEGQLLVLNIEGIKSEMNIYNYCETKREEVNCYDCDGIGYNYCPCCNQKVNCSCCNGTGAIDFTIEVPVTDVEIESNIFI